MVCTQHQHKELLDKKYSKASPDLTRTSENDPDFQAILKTFEQVQKMLVITPRIDMPGSQPAPDVCRITH
jgi:hypothetical protein